MRGFPCDEVDVRGLCRPGRPTTTMEAEDVKKLMRICGGFMQMMEKTPRLELSARRGMVESFGGMRGVSFPARLGDAGAKGRGVFATRPVKKGQVVTLYPCHMLCTRTDATWGQPMIIATRALSTGEAESLCDYGQFLSRTADGKVYQLIGDPSHPFEPHGCGHMINDPHPAAETICTRPGSPEELWRAFLEYELRIKGAMNCVLEPFEGLGVLCVATRDIAEGEEVLAPYGYEYWCKLEGPQMMDWFMAHSVKLRRERPGEYQAACKILRRFIDQITSS